MAKNFAVLLYDVAALTSGYEIEDSSDFAGRILSIMTSKAKSDVMDAEVEMADVVQEKQVEDDVVEAMIDVQENEQSNEDSSTN